MAAFISSAWQGAATRIPGTGTKLSERQSADVVSVVVQAASPATRLEAQALLEGSRRELSRSAKAELNALVTGYVRSGAGR